MIDSYERIKIGGHYVWIRRDTKKKMDRVDGLIFDCDGVIFDVTRSFREAILRTVRWFFGEVMRVKEPAISYRHIQLFKNTGAFNNDWEVTYAIILYHFTILLAGSKPFMVEGATRKSIMETYEFFKKMGENLRGRVMGKEGGLRRAIEKVGAEGLRGMEKVAVDMLAEAWKIERDEARLILEDVSPFKGEIHSENIIKRFFEEIYCGSKLFEEIYGDKTVFYHGKGLIENEKPIIKQKALKSLLSMGFPPIGIASGRMRKQTAPLLEKYNLRGYFNLEASTFLEEIEKDEEEFRRRGKNVKLDKPNPYPLISTAIRMKINDGFVYVGDTVADVIACLNAEAEGKYVAVSVGVLCSTKRKEELLAKFLELGCNIIMPNPNDLPKVIEEA